jgi:hypothetical protein
MDKEVVLSPVAVGYAELKVELVAGKGLLGVSGGGWLAAGVGQQPFAAGVVTGQTVVVAVAVPEGQ